MFSLLFIAFIFWARRSFCDTVTVEPYMCGEMRRRGDAKEENAKKACTFSPPQYHRNCAASKQVQGMKSSKQKGEYWFPCDVPVMFL